MTLTEDHWNLGKFLVDGAILKYALEIYVNNSLKDRCEDCYWDRITKYSRE